MQQECTAGRKYMIGWLSMVNRKDLTSRVIRLLKLDITTFLTSLAPILSLYILGGFINKEIIGVFGFTYAFQFLWSMFSRGFNHPIFLYAFKDIKNDKDKTMSIVFSGCIVLALIELVVYILFMLYAKQFLFLLKVSNELIDICYIYTIYAIAAIGLQLIDTFIFSFYEYTGRLELNNKLGLLYAILRVGGSLLCVSLNNFISLSNLSKLCILLLPIIGFTLTMFLKVLREINHYQIHFTWEFLSAFKYGIRDILKGILNTIGNFIGTRNINLAGITTTSNSNGSTAFQYAFITTVTDIQWDCACEESTLVSLDIASEPVKYKNINQINDKKLFNILKLDILAGYIVLGIIFILALVILGILSFFLTITDYMLLNMSLDIVGMIIDTSYYAMSSFLNSLGRYKELSIISIVAVTLRIFASSIRSVYAVNIGMITSACIQIVLITSLFLYYKYKHISML